PTLPSQSPKPVVQLRWQAPETHEGVSLLVLHAAPQPPQFMGAVLMLSLHPVPLLLREPGGDDEQPQVPFVQLGVPFAPQGQTWRHMPQLLAFWFRLVSQPVAGVPLQLPKPVVHDRTQVPPGHVAVSLLVLQTLPHAPQFEVEVVLVSQPLLG